MRTVSTQQSLGGGISRQTHCKGFSAGISRRVCNSLIVERINRALILVFVHSPLSRDVYHHKHIQVVFLDT